MNSIQNIIIKELTIIGYDITHSGNRYLVEIINNIYDKNLVDCINLEKDIYPLLAKKYRKSPSAIKASIDYATTLMYFKCDANRLMKYFNLSNDKYKPTTKTVIYTILNKI